MSRRGGAPAGAGQRDLFNQEGPSPQELTRRATLSALAEALAKVPPHVRWSATSRRAAREVMAVAPTYRLQALLFIALQGARGATYWEVEEFLCVRPSTASARCNELMNAGLIKDSGRTRPTVTGAQATVWVATARAREAVLAAAPGVHPQLRQEALDL